MALKLYDTYKKEIVEFIPIAANEVRLYTCGPTVYLDPHIGNMRTFLFYDILHRVLAHLGYRVKRVMNITDVGHLTSDADEGEDKLEKGARIQNKTVWQVAQHYTDVFLKDTADLNMIRPEILTPATGHIPEIIELVQKLLDNNSAYETPEAIYFDIAKFPKYELLIGQKFENMLKGAREEVVTETSKKHPADFALWFKTVGRFEHHAMRWQSPWGEGFPGWHIECSAISRKFLGQPFDIHTGGVDHLFPHHPNEIAQSEAAFGVPLANYWLHGEHLLVEGQKMSKSRGNLFTLSDLKAKGFSAFDFRYLVLTSHYQNKLNFTWEGLRAASQARSALRAAIAEYDDPSEPDEGVLARFRAILENNLDTPGAIALLWELIRESQLPNSVKRATINEMEKVLGLDLANLKPRPIPPEVHALAKKRDQARVAKNWEESDTLRGQIENLGFNVEDTPEGTKIRPK